MGARCEPREERGAPRTDPAKHLNRERYKFKATRVKIMSVWALVVGVFAGLSVGGVRVSIVESAASWGAVCEGGRRRGGRHGDVDQEPCIPEVGGSSIGQGAGGGGRCFWPGDRRGRVVRRTCYYMSSDRQWYNGQAIDIF